MFAASAASSARVRTLPVEVTQATAVTALHSSTVDRTAWSPLGPCRMAWWQLLGPPVHVYVCRNKSSHHSVGWLAQNLKNIYVCMNMFSPAILLEETFA
jgi:hypothetical protein